MDIENLEQPPVKEDATKGLLAPKKRPMPQQSNMSSEPAFRVGQHMRLFRKQREMLKDA